MESFDIQTESIKIIDSILDRVLFYCKSDPLAELTNRQKLEPNFQSKAPKIKVLSYNVLAESLQKENTKDAFPHEPKYVDFQNRWPLIVKEVHSYKPDIACLQEIDKDNETIPSQFQSDYHTFFKSRRGDKADGCLTMIRKESMELIATHYMEFYYDNNHLLLCKDNVCVITVVAAKNSPGHLFFIANTHILFNDNRGDIKTCQIYMAIKAIRELADSTKFKNFSKHFIYCGDFNMTPTSALYDIISRGSYNYKALKKSYLTGQKLGKLSSFRDSTYFQSYRDFLLNNVNSHRPHPKNAETDLNGLATWLRELHKVKLIITHPTDGQPSEIKYEIQDLDFSQVPLDDNFFTLNMPLRMLSAYSTFQRFFFSNHGSSNPYPKYSTYEPIVTSCPHESKHTVDYIWFTTYPNQKGNMLRVRSVVALPNYEQIMRYKIFPNRIYPSDHLSLVAELELV